jgi:SAM-dependent methyltransferase
VHPSELSKMFEVEDTYWWFVARRWLVRALLDRHLPAGAAPRRIVDVGCGTGATLGTLAEYGEVIGIDRSPYALHYCRERGHHRLARGDAAALPLADESVDVVTALDLLEHIGDDARAVREFVRVLRPGGLLIATVPAGPMLWSEHDEALDHLRRYRAREFRRLLDAAGLQVLRFSPLITTLLAPIALLRLAQRLRPKRGARPQTALIIPPPWINRWLIRLLLWENRWLLRFRLPFGVSLVAAAGKTAGDRGSGIEDRETAVESGV